jgi:hypothetical protein
VWLNCGIGVALNLLVLAGSVEIGAIFSVGAIAQYVAFLVPLVLRVVFPSNFKKGPWNMGALSRPCNIIAIGWMLLMIPIFCFPSTNGDHLNAATMNWTCVVYGGVMSAALGWYAISARHWFVGPKATVEEVPKVDGEGGNGVMRSNYTAGM